MGQTHHEPFIKRVEVNGRQYQIHTNLPKTAKQLSFNDTAATLEIAVSTDPDKNRMVFPVEDAGVIMDLIEEAGEHYGINTKIPGQFDLEPEPEPVEAESSEDDPDEDSEASDEEQQDEQEFETQKPETADPAKIAKLVEWFSKWYYKDNEDKVVKLYQEQLDRSPDQDASKYEMLRDVAAKFYDEATLKAGMAQWEEQHAERMKAEEESKKTKPNNRRQELSEMSFEELGVTCESLGGEVKDFQTKIQVIDQILELETGETNGTAKKKEPDPAKGTVPKSVTCPTCGAKVDDPNRFGGPCPDCGYEPLPDPNEKKSNKTAKA